MGYNTIAIYFDGTNDRFINRDLTTETWAKDAELMTDAEAVDVCKKFEAENPGTIPQIEDIDYIMGSHFFEH